MTDDKYVTRQTLILRACNQADEHAWEEFVEFYQKFIYHILHKMNISLNDFDDLVQVVLLQLWKGLSTYRADESKFRTWLSRYSRYNKWTKTFQETTLGEWSGGGPISIAGVN